MRPEMQPKGGSGVALTLGFVIGAFLLVAGATFYFAQQEIATIKNQHHETLEAETREAANQIQEFIRSRQQLVEAFAIEKEYSLSLLINDPENQDARETIAESLERWFPTYFTFTVADERGTDLIDDLDGFVGPQCQLSIQNYIRKLAGVTNTQHAQEIVIHPQANNYHFDVMAPWRTGDFLRGVFFVSFYPATLQEALRTHQSPGHHLVLVHKERENLIEVTADGARDEISKSRDINLTSEEIAVIAARRDIDQSLWQLVGYTTPGLLDDIKRGIWMNVGFILFFLVLAGTMSCRKILQLDRRQRMAFDQLRITNLNLAEMAEKQRSLREAAEAGEQSKAQFLASMSHEIRTPLNAVIGLTDLVLNTDLTDDQRGRLSRVSLAGRNLLGLINDILDFSKIEAGKLQIETIDFDLDDVLTNVATVVSTKAFENNNELIVSVDRNIPSALRGDPLRLGQILINLAGNAAKFTENGEIIVDVSAANADGEDWLAISVRDTGIGMTEEQTERLFRPFTQADQAVTRTHGGTGLGLSISLQLAEAMGGKIGVDSVPGEGSTFHFRIPLVAGASAEQRNEFEGVDPRTIRVLIVDDNHVVLETLSDALTRLKFKVDTATSGRAAIEKFSATGDTAPVDILIMDWRMDGMDGTETIRKINAKVPDEDRPQTIMISAADMSSIRPELRELGVQNFIEKPINTSYLIDTMMGIFDKNLDRRPVRFTDDESGKPSAVKRGVKLLVAEDNELNQMVATGVLNGAGFEIDIAENGAIALEKLRAGGEDHYGLVLMDIQMPEMDGLTATQQIRNELKFDALPVVAMTAHALDEERDRCMKAGMNDHISKPIDARELISKVNKWLDGRVTVSEKTS